jgi:hypothetical protein
LQTTQRVGGRVIAAKILLSVHVSIASVINVAAAVLFLTRFRLLYPDWHGYVISFFGRVWVSNFYMAGFANLRLDIHHERVEIKSKDLDVQSKSEQLKMDGVA